MSSLKIHILNLVDRKEDELVTLLKLARININNLLSYMEGQRFAHEQMISDLTLIVDHGDQWNQEPAKEQRSHELAMSNAYHNVMGKLKFYDTRPKTNIRFTKVNIRQMVDEIKKGLREEVPQMKHNEHGQVDFV